MILRRLIITAVTTLTLYGAASNLWANDNAGLASLQKQIQMVSSGIDPKLKTLEDKLTASIAAQQQATNQSLANMQKQIAASTSQQQSQVQKQITALQSQIAQLQNNLNGKITKIQAEIVQLQGAVK